MKVKDLEAKRILIFLLITFFITWVYCLLVVYPLVSGSLNSAPAISSQLTVAACMFFPAIGVVLTRLITKEGFQNAWLRPNLKKNLKYYLLAWFGPGVLTVIGAVLYFLLFPSSYDPHFGYIVQMLEAAGTPSETIPLPLETLIVVQAVQGLLLAPIMNFFTCFGEEWGWGGYLLPKMAERMPTVPMLLLSGIIWGFWHAPLTLIGHNYGVGYPGFPFAGIGMMCVFCIAVGTFLSYITLKTRSCIPAILAHGAINGFSAIGLFFTHDGGNPFIGPIPTGIIGMVPFILVAVCMAFALKKQKQ